MADRPYVTLLRSPNEWRARKAAEFYAEPAATELGAERRVIRVVKTPVWWEVRSYPYSWFRGQGAAG